MFERHGNYRFHFKAMDPEFGTVKEEVSVSNANCIKLVNYSQFLKMCVK